MRNDALGKLRGQSVGTYPHHGRRETGISQTGRCVKKGERVAGAYTIFRGRGRRGLLPEKSVAGDSFCKEFLLGATMWARGASRNA